MLKIKLLPYSPKYKSKFKKIKRDLLTIVDNKDEIEHIGSTAINGISAKPIIDILIGINTNEIDSYIPKIKKLGFIYEKKYEKKIENRRFFYKNKNNHREIHIHLVNKNTYWYKRHIAFRNALRQNALLKLQYQALKTKLSEKEWIDSNEYAEAKSPFIRSIEKKLNII
ncbi:MAG: hypothetical protein CMP51_00705 [Flavobacteriales bacterium]|nr:hypothetical protein [Flavobacteriales bacterium]